MSTLLSPIASIDRIQIEPIPTNRQVRGARVVRVDRTTVMVDDKGTIYSSQVSASCAYAFGCNMEDTLRGVQRLGLLSKAAVDQHQGLIRERDERRKRFYAAQNIEEQAKLLGFKLTKAQRDRIVRTLKTDKEA